MALQLVTGPVNASKAGVVLGLVRRWSREGLEPVLIVPTGPDADTYRRELLGAGGALTGVTVGPPAALASIARRAAGLPRPSVGGVLRDRLLAAALAEVPRGRPLHGAAHRPGVRRRMLDLLDELRERRVGVDDLVDGLARADLAEHAVAPRLAADLAGVLDGYLGRLRGVAAGGPLGVAGVDQAAERAAVLDGDRPGVEAAVAELARESWPADPPRPVALYGFDDLTVGQLRLVAAVAARAPVAVSLPFEDGRPATAARRTLVEELRAEAAVLRERARDAAAGRRAGAAPAFPLVATDPLLEGLRVARVDPAEVVLAAPDRGGALVHLAGRLFGEADGPGVAASPAATTAAPAAATPPDEAPTTDAGVEEGAEDVVLLEAGDPRAEAEQLADEFARARAELRGRGDRAPRCAVAVRDAGGAPGARLERELRTRGLPVLRRRELPVGASPVGRAALAALRLGLGLGAAFKFYKFFHS